MLVRLVALSAFGCIVLNLIHPASADIRRSSQGETVVGGGSSGLEPALEVGLNLHEFSYAEELKSHPGKSTESGVVPEFQAGFSLKPTLGRWQLRSLFSFSSGTTQHDGTDMSGEKSFVFDNPATFFNFELNGLQEVAEFAFVNGGQKAVLDGYLGLGYRLWSRGDKRTVNAVSNYNETYRWFYAPVGLILTQPISNSVSVALDASVRPTFGGKMNAKLSDINAKADDLTVDLGSELGWRLSLPVCIQVARRTALQLTPFYESSAIGTSPMTPVTSGGQPTKLGIMEPDSHTNQYGLETRVRVSI